MYLSPIFDNFSGPVNLSGNEEGGLNISFWNEKFFLRSSQHCLLLR